MTANAQLIISSGAASVTVSASEEAKQERDRLLGKSRLQVTIASQTDADYAARGLKALKGFSRQIEEARKSAKAPLKEVVDRIDAIGHSLMDEIDAEADRLSRLHGAWQAEQNKLAEKARQDAWEKEQAIRAEAERVERLKQEAAEAEARRQEAIALAEANVLREKQAAEARALKAKQEAEEKERQAKLDAAKSKAAKEKAAIALKEVQEKAAAEEIALKARQEAEAKENAAKAEREAAELKERQSREESARVDALAVEIVETRETAVAVRTAVRSSGTGTREEIKFEVQDAAALYRAFPHLVKLEPQTALIKAQIKTLSAGATLPGVKHWKESATYVR